MAQPQPSTLDNSYLHLLVHAGEILGSSLDYNETLRNVCRAAVETVADICVLDLKNERGVITLAAAAHRDPEKTAAVRKAGRYLRSAEGYPLHPVLHALDRNEPIFIETIDQAYIEANATSPAHAQFMREMKYRSLIVVPVISTAKGVLGALRMIRTGDSDRRPFDEGALLFAEDIGRRCGAALSKAMLYSQTLAFATRMQLAALPRALPRAEPVVFSAYYEPAQTEWLVGGDWYDAFALSDGRFGISIGDISGHGVEAAALMVGLRDGIRALLYADLSLSEALLSADRLVSAEFPEGKYATAMIGIFDARKRTLSCAAAGHPGPLIWNPSEGKSIDPFTDRGLPLGLRTLCPQPKSIETIALEPGALGVFFTDGVSEWSRDYLAGEAAIKQALAQAAVRASNNVARAIRDAVVRGNHTDDIALLTLTLLP